MPILTSGICGACNQGFHHLCEGNQCQCNCPIEPQFYLLTLSREELEGLNRFLLKEYVSHENEHAHTAIRKIMKLAQEHELDRQPSKST